MCRLSFSPLSFSVNLKNVLIVDWNAKAQVSMQMYRSVNYDAHTHVTTTQVLEQNGSQPPDAQQIYAPS